MSDQKRSRLAVVLKLARRREQEAGISRSRAEEQVGAAENEVSAAASRSNSSADGGTVADFKRQVDSTELRAQQVLEAEQTLQDRLSDAFQARAELLDSVRRRQSLERVDARHQKVRGIIAAQAAQRALDEMGSRRAASNDGSQL